MPESDNTNPNRPDPLLGSDSFIDVDEIGSPERLQHQSMGDFDSMHVIDAKPISMVPPDDVSAEVTPKAVKRRSIEEMAKRPSWLPENWRIDLRVRSSGASSGLIDRYFFDPSGRKFRSQNEVLHFLETGNKLKRNAEDVQPSGSSSSQKPKKRSSQKLKKPSSVKRAKSEAIKVGVTCASDILDSVDTNTPQKI